MNYKGLVGSPTLSKALRERWFKMAAQLAPAYFGHRLPRELFKKWEPWLDRLHNVVNLASEFAITFGATGSGRRSGSRP